MQYKLSTAIQYPLVSREFELKIHTRTCKQGRKNRTSKQSRPFSRTLMSVHDSTLEDVVYPTEIVARRTRVRVDGAKIQKVSSYHQVAFQLLCSDYCRQIDCTG
jgi:small subunit ribosomal protein S7e